MANDVDESREDRRHVTGDTCAGGLGLDFAEEKEGVEAGLISTIKDGRRTAAAGFHS